MDVKLPPPPTFVAPPVLSESVSDPSDLLSSLRPPPPYAVRVTNLTIVAPIPPITIPLAIPIVLPAFLTRGRTSSGEQRTPTELVRAVNLVVEPREVLAIAGGSGSGKTTLLHAIACRLGDLEVAAGEVTFVPRTAEGETGRRGSAEKEGRELGSGRRKGVSKIIGFVRQDDFLLPYLTVRETLSFAAALRLPASVSAETKAAIVEQTITELGLRGCADVLVGGPFRKGISGGEKRRLSIGCILVTMPSVLVLDEPTTGLDAFTSLQILQTLSKLARRGRVVILSIHQPRSDAFELFDKVALLSSGSVVYSGLASRILPHFRDQGYTPDEHTNPLDFVVDISSIDTRDDETETLTRVRVGRLVVAWREHELASREAAFSSIYTSPSETSGSIPTDVEQGIHRVTSRASQIVHNPKLEGRAGWWTQVGLLTRRGLLNVTRNYGQTLGLLIQFVVIGVVLGLAFLNPPETPGGIQTLKTIVYQSTPAVFYLSIIVSCWIQTGDLVIFDREREDALYSTTPYIVSAFISYAPANIIFPSIYAVIIYFMCGFWRHNLAVNVFSFIAQCILQQFCSWGYALLAASINRSFAQASLLANGFSIPFILSSGYLIVDLPVWISWTRWISPYFYGFHWIGRLQFVGRTFACEGITGPARNACDGTQVLLGLKFPLSTPLYVYPLGLVGFIVVTEGLAILLLEYYHPGGVKHAAQRKGDDTKVAHVEKAPPGGHHVDLDQKERVEVAVERLTLDVAKKGLLGRGPPVTKCILAEVDAVFPAGQVSVIMGPSGAGKSSLLQLLAGRLNAGSQSDFASTGAILLNGRRLDSSTREMIAFVEQEDAHHLPALTVRETLRYAARLRLRGKTHVECDARAEEVLRMLGLKSCADNLVGGELLKGISGGEKRRLSLGVQLISDPSVLLADEPLSGLDAFTAQNVMTTLKEIANSGRTVIVSVHQPRSDIWRLFDNVLILVKGGKSAYSGPRSEILKTFEAAGLHCPPTFNPADFILDAVSVDYRTTASEAQTERRVSQILAIYDNSALSGRRASREVASRQDVASPVKSAPFLVAFPVVLGRSFKNLRRQQDVFVARLANPPFMALLMWLFFARLKLGPSGAQDRVGLLQETTALPFVGMLACVAIFPTERQLFFHEWKSSARQSVVTFALAYSVQESAVTLVSSCLFSLIFVFGVGLRHTARIFFEFWFASYCLISTGESIGIIFSTFFENGGLAVSLVSAGLTLLSQLNGIISVTLPRWLYVIGWASPMRAQSFLCIINEMQGLVFNCTTAEIASGACIAATGDQLLDTFGITNQSTGKLVGILAALVVLFRIFAVIALQIRVRSL